MGLETLCQKKTAQPHLTARLPQVAQKPPRQRHLAAQEKKNAAKTKAPERRSRTRDTSKPIARVSAGSCNFKPESRENAMRQCLQRPSQNGDKTNKKRPPNQVTQGHLAQGGGKQPGNRAPPSVDRRKVDWTEGMDSFLAWAPFLSPSKLRRRTGCQPACDWALSPCPGGNSGG